MKIISFLKTKKLAKSKQETIDMSVARRRFWRGFRSESRGKIGTGWSCSSLHRYTNRLPSSETAVECNSQVDMQMMCVCVGVHQDGLVCLMWRQYYGSRVYNTDVRATLEQKTEKVYEQHEIAQNCTQRKSF